MTMTQHLKYLSTKDQDSWNK